MRGIKWFTNGALFKKIVISLIFCVEIALFMYVYLYGKNGMYVLREMQQENKKIEHILYEESKQIAVLENEIDQWGRNNFYKEKIARETLQMARKGDEIYYIVST